MPKLYLIAVLMMAYDESEKKDESTANNILSNKLTTQVKEIHKGEINKITLYSTDTH